MIPELPEKIDNVSELIEDQTAKFIQVPEDLLARLRKENSELEQFKQLTNLQVQVKELQFKNTILETYVKMGLKPTDSFNINTGLAEIK